MATRSGYRRAIVVALCLPLFTVACGGPAYQTRVIETPGAPPLKGHQKAYEVNGERYHPLREHQGFTEEGLASWYGSDFHGKRTSNGEIYDMYALTAAHKTLPLGVSVRVTNTVNGRSMVVRVNDRGPFVRGRIIDLSYTAAKELGVVGPGTAPVRVEALGYLDGDIAKGGFYRQVANYDKGNFAVQIGAFVIEANARNLADESRRRYGKAEIRKGTVDGKVFYRVQVGQYRSLTAAHKAEIEFNAAEYPGAFVVAVDP